MIRPALSVALAISLAADAAAAAGEAIDLKPERVVVFPMHGPAVAARLSSLSGDSLLLRSSTRTTGIPIDSILGIGVLGGEKRSSTCVAAMVYAAYAANFALMRPEGQPAGFVRNESDDTLAYVLLNSVVPSSVWLIAYVVSGSAPAFPLEPQDRERAGKSAYRDWLIGRFGQRSAPPRVHAGLSLGQVVARNGEMPRGARVEYGYGDFPEHRAYAFTLLRSLDVLYRVTPKIQVGLKRIWMDEPEIGYVVPDRTGYVVPYRTRLRSHEASAWLGEVRFFPRDRHVYLSAGIGRGVMRSRVLDKINSPTYATADRSVKRAGPCAAISGGIDLYTHDAISFGFAADYVFGPSETLEAIPALGLGSERIRMGNGCVGFSMGLHF